MSAISNSIGPVINGDTLPLIGVISGNTIILSWNPITCLGYVLYINGVRKSNSWDASKSSWKASYTIGNIYRVVAIAETASGGFSG